MRKYLKYSIIFNVLIAFIVTSTGYSTSLENPDQRLPVVVASPKIITHLAYDPDDILDIIKVANQGDINRQNQLIDQYQNIDPVVLKKIDLRSWPDLLYRLQENPGLLDLLQIIEFNLNLDMAREVFEHTKTFENSSDLQRRTNLAKMYFMGMGTLKNNSKALELFEKLDVKKFAPAQYNLGLMLLLNSTPESKAKSIRLFQEAADQKYTYAENYLAGVFVFAGQDDHLTKGFNLHLSAANKGHGGSALQVAYMCDEGIGTSQNLKKALKYYKIAVAQGLAVSQYNLGFRYQEGKFIPLNLKKAVELFKQGANQANPDDQYNLASCYSAGYGITGNATEAIRWFHEAALNGSLDAQRRLFSIFNPKLHHLDDFKRQQTDQKLDYFFSSIMTIFDDTLKSVIDKNKPYGLYLSNYPGTLTSPKIFKNFTAISNILKELSKFKAIFSSPGFMVDYLKNAEFFKEAAGNEFVKGYAIPYQDKIHLFISYGFENVQYSENFIQTMNQLNTIAPLISTYTKKYKLDIEHYKQKTLRLRQEINENISLNLMYTNIRDREKIIQNHIAKIDDQRKIYEIEQNLLENNQALLKSFKKIKKLYETMMTLFLDDTNRRNHTLANQYFFLKN
ncbi:MAG: tetratricopeptide repeat protein [Janthinobacterium lividum]